MLKILSKRHKKISDGLNEANKEYLDNLRKELKELEKRKVSTNGIPCLEIEKR